MHHPTDRITHTTDFVTPVVEHWLEREIAQWVHPMKDRSDDPSHHERTLLPRSYISLRDAMGWNQLATSCTVPLVIERERDREKEREMFYLTTHSTHFIYGYMASALVIFQNNGVGRGRGVTARRHVDDVLQLVLVPFVAGWP